MLSASLYASRSIFLSPVRQCGMILGRPYRLNVSPESGGGVQWGEGWTVSTRRRGATDTPSHTTHECSPRAPPPATNAQAARTASPPTWAGCPCRSCCRRPWRDRLVCARVCVWNGVYALLKHGGTGGSQTRRTAIRSMEGAQSGPWAAGVGRRAGEVLGEHQVPSSWSGRGFSARKNGDAHGALSEKTRESTQQCIRRSQWSTPCSCGGRRADGDCRVWGHGTGHGGERDGGT